MNAILTSVKAKSAVGREVADVQGEIESKLFRMADLKAVTEIPYRELLEQVDHVVRELEKSASYCLSAAAHKRLVATVTENLVRKSQLVAA